MTVRELHERLGRIMAERGGADIAPVDVVEQFPDGRVSASIVRIDDVGNGRVVIVAPGVRRNGSWS